MDLYTPTELLGVVDTVIPEQSYWLPSFFTEEHQFQTEEVLFDKIAHNRTLAPFVGPNNQGRPMRKRGYQTTSVKPAYIKPKDKLTPNMAYKRRAGEALGTGSLTPAERWDALVADQVSEHVRAIQRRWEWMAAQAALFAQITLVAEDYPSTFVDFGRDPSLTIALTGTARWGQSAADIVGNLEDWSQRIRDLTGYVVTRVTMTPDVWRVMRKDPDVIALMETRRGSSSTAELGPQADLRYKNVAQVGEFDIWTYQDTYIDEDGNVQQLMPAGTVFLGSPEGMQGIRCFGAIQDKGADLQALSIFTKMWDEEDPSGTFVMSQSSPIMVPRNPNASLRAVVL